MAVGSYLIVPVANWLLPAGGRDLPVELGTGAGFAVMALRFGLSPVLPAFLLLAALAPVLTVIDLRWRRLPDPLTLPAYPAAVLLLAAGALAVPGGTRHFLTALATARTKMRRFSFSWSLASEATRLATFSCYQPWVLIGLLAVGTIPPCSWLPSVLSSWRRKASAPPLR